MNRQEKDDVTGCAERIDVRVRAMTIAIANLSAMDLTGGFAPDIQTIRASAGAIGAELVTLKRMAGGSGL